MAKILVNIGEGLGNQVETIPALLYLREKHGHDITLLNLIPTYRDASVIFNMLGFKGVLSTSVAKWDGQYSTFSCAMADIFFPHVPILNKVDKTFIDDHSEVQFNMSMVDRNYTDSDCMVPSELFDKVEPLNGVNIDVLIHDGYNKSNPEMWKAKSYPYYQQVARELQKKGLIVGSIGAVSEYVPNTVNMTGLPLAQTMRLLKSVKLLIANDTGTYHLASMMGVPTLVVFTFTSVQKNCDHRFHQSASIITRDDIACRPCQNKSPARYWINNKQTCKWACREVNYQVVTTRALQMMGVI